jgi:predicted RNase H-like HicB family nuclease
MLERMAEYHVVYARREAGDWRAFVRGLRRCRSRGRTLRQARVALRRALAHVVADPYAIDFVEDVRLPGAARRLIGGHWSARRKAERAQKAADAATGRALQALRGLSINLKDASDLLGIPPAKLQTLDKAARKAR